MGPLGCPETSVQNYHSALRNTPEERRYHVHRGGSVKSVSTFKRSDKQNASAVGVRQLVSPGEGNVRGTAEPVL
jgi:hypothetical protein